MPALKYSRQRESIKEFLVSRLDHPTADTIYMNIREKFPNISLGTVYRNLSLLTDIGEIQKLSLGDGADRFDGNIKPHNHFICDKCHCVMDMEQEDLPNLVTLANKNFEGIIHSHTIIFHGTCKNCLECKES